MSYLRFEKILSIHETRVVNNDFTLSYKGQWFQLGATQPILVLQKDRVQIEERIDGKIFISLRNKYLNYEVLPERPKKIHLIKVAALTNARPLWKPPADHPWRRSLILNSQRYQMCL